MLVSKMIVGHSELMLFLNHGPLLELIELFLNPGPLLELIEFKEFLHACIGVFAHCKMGAAQFVMPDGPGVRGIPFAE